MSAQKFNGEIYLRDNSEMYLNQIYVTNLNTLKTSLSSYNGSFSIDAKPGETVRFTSIISERKDIKITEEMLNTSLNLVELKIAYYDIQEVLISRFKVSGNLKKDVLALKTDSKKMEIQKMIGLPQPVGDGNSPILPIASLSGGGLSFSLESIYDVISGERKKKERYMAYEKMNKSISEIKNYYGSEYFKKLKIPENLIDNFMQFIYSSDNIQGLVDNYKLEAVQIYIEKYLPIYQKRLESSQLLNIVK